MVVPMPATMCSASMSLGSIPEYANLGAHQLAAHLPKISGTQRPGRVGLGIPRVPCGGGSTRILASGGEHAEFVACQCAGGRFRPGQTSLQDAMHQSWHDHGQRCKHWYCKDTQNPLRPSLPHRFVSSQGSMHGLIKPFEALRLEEFHPGFPMIAISQFTNSGLVQDGVDACVKQLIRAMSWHVQRLPSS
mmetsp:Transcript_142527/g.454819  ORF Transcript_142527/g.454819 Transcript_142527/m.454819 type:complete len:190 (-) Transcript_142527:106-675(-)